MIGLKNYSDNNGSTTISQITDAPISLISITDATALKEPSGSTTETSSVVQITPVGNLFTTGNQNENSNSITAINLIGLFSKEIISTTPLAININGETPFYNQTTIDNMYRLRLMNNNTLWRSLPIRPTTMEETPIGNEATGNTTSNTRFSYSWNNLRGMHTNSNIVPNMMGSTTENIPTPGNIQTSEPYSSISHIWSPYLRTLAITPGLIVQPSVDGDNQTSTNVSYYSIPNPRRPITPIAYWRSLPVTRIDRKPIENQNITEMRPHISPRSFTIRIRNRTAVYTTTKKYRIRKTNLTRTNKIKPVKRVVPVVSVPLQSYI